MTSVSLRASAKINLDLKILARRSDGHHDLHTVFQTLHLHDSLIVEPTGKPFALLGDATQMPLDRTNLVWKAADALWRAAGREGEPGGARVRVRKRIPAQAGLGGGSSDAAAALVGLARVWGIRLRLPDLLRVAAGLGADVPYFLMGGTALGLGRGERLFPMVDLPQRPVLLVFPDFGVSTADAYRWFAESRECAGTRDLHRHAEGPAPGTRDDVWVPWPSLAGCVNDLEGPVEAHHPEIAAIREALTASGAELARMSGSGSAVFGVFRSSGDAKRAATHLRRQGRRTLLTRTRGRTTEETRRLTRKM